MYPWLLKRAAGDTEACWLWPRHIRRNGYGQAWDVKRQLNVTAHRVMYEEIIGSLVLGMEIDHLCFNRGCVNPLHLEQVTPEENKRRMKTHQRGKGACDHGHAWSKHAYFRSNGTRFCKQCRKERDHARRL